MVEKLRSLPINPYQSTRTYYYNQRRNQQIKVYDKALEQGLIGQLTRIEKKHKVRVGKRKTLEDFLLDERLDVFKGLRLIDVDKIDGRLTLKKSINNSKSLMHAYKSLDNSERKKMKRHQAFKVQCIDIHSRLSANIEKWLATSKMLKLKIIIDSLGDTWINTRNSCNVQFSSSAVITSSHSIKLIGWSVNKRVKIAPNFNPIPLELN
ncbi:hypothetical protein [Alkalibacillus haloalkaliphilus]|uniref:hypothetical protein n=1 Tax=Alkalibacillus haloalkaliphilus TaxID=94136 RepID=UPI0003146327|nr:hypothetical protein [Alkalibacillus haloalkaliphilus]